MYIRCFLPFITITVCVVCPAYQYHSHDSNPNQAMIHVIDIDIVMQWVPMYACTYNKSSIIL